MTDGEIMKDAGAVANSKGQTAITEYGRKERQEEVREKCRRQEIKLVVFSQEILFLGIYQSLPGTLEYFFLT